MAVFCLVLSIGQVFAQSTVTGGIRGTVTDPQRAIVPNATVTTTNVGTNSTETVTTDANGTFIINNLQPGTYNVAVNQSGFGDFTAQRVVVEVGQVTTVDATLTVAGTSATVEVTAEAPVINTNSNDFATNVNQTSINELPINGRRASNFVILTPATVPDGTFGLISFRGISGLLNNSTVDGGDNNQAFFSEERGRTRINYVVSQSAVREFQVNTSNYSAEYGRSAGGVINTVTKSGTNEFHGELFYYNRNNRNGARNPRAFQSVLVNGVSTLVAAKPIDLRQQFGGAIGGPIIKDRLFFFFSYDQQKRNFPGLSVFSNPNFLNTADTLRLTTPLGQQVPGRTTGTLGLGLTPTQVGNTLQFLNSLSGETPRQGDQTIYLPKIDWQINGNNLFSATYNRLRWDSPSGIQTQAVNTRGRQSFGDDFVRVDSLNLRLQSTISSNTLNEARFQYGRDFEFQISQAPLMGEPTTGTTGQGSRSPSVFITNGLEFGTPTFLERPSYPDERRIQFANTVTYTRGRHTFKFGGDINRVTDDIQNLRFEAGAYSYTGTGAIDNFIIDYVNFRTPLPAATRCATGTRFAGRCYTGNFQQGFGLPGIKFTTYDYNFFFQDDFRVTPRLTFNLGMRYEYQKMPETVFANTRTDVIPNSGLTAAEATSQLPNDTNNFGPRVGFAYDFFGNGKTSLRGGYGIYYGRIINATIYNALVNTGNPNGQAQLSVAPTVTTNCFPLVSTATIPCAPIFPNVLPSSTTAVAGGGIQYFNENFQAPLINQYDLILEHQIAQNTVVSASYIGSLGRSLPTFVDQNLVRTGATTTFTTVGGPNGGQSFNVPLFARTSFGSQAVTEIQSSVRTNYNALVLQANRRFTAGLQFQASYTLSKATDTGQTSAAFPASNSPLDVADRSFDSGTSNFDVRHKFVVSAVYAPNPYKGNANSFYNYLLNGWSIAPIYALYAGRVYDGNVSGASLNGSFGDNRLPINERNAFRLPKLSNLDVRLSKRFRFTERYNLELLAEGFNVLNRTHVFFVNSTLYTRSGNVLTFNPQFGQVTGTDSTLYRERQIQFAARFQF
ncbi:MAG: TonB-dependent receptor [Acidobacteriota bacterium]|nr:TonB-dependent receptor [Acidobacteriota bacterium]